MSLTIPAWKKWASYFTEIRLEETSSVYNKHLLVSLVNGRLMLSTNNAIYSYGDKYHNFGHTFKKLNLSGVNEVLLLGFGLGSIPHILEKKEKKFFSYTGVEIDEEVIYLASKYVLPNLTSDIDLITSDAITFLSIDTYKYDLIAMDIFESDYIPDRFETEEYLESLRDRITENGIILYNRLACTKNEIDKSTYYYHEVFNKVFPESTYLTIRGNLMLINRSDVLK